jgi:hypothetical protein
MKPSMRCYYHREADALGVCRSCQRGICAACVAEVEPDGIACVGRCEAAAQAAGRVWAKTESLNRIGGYLLLTIGAAFAGIAVHDGLTAGVDLTLLILIIPGLLFLGFGGSIVLRLSTKRPS